MDDSAAIRTRKIRIILRLFDAIAYVGVGLYLATLILIAISCNVAIPWCSNIYSVLPGPFVGPIISALGGYWILLRYRRRKLLILKSTLDLNASGAKLPINFITKGKHNELKPSFLLILLDIAAWCFFIIFCVSIVWIEAIKVQGKSEIKSIEATLWALLAADMLPGGFGLAWIVVRNGRKYFREKIQSQKLDLESSPSWLPVAAPFIVIIFTFFVMLVLDTSVGDGG